MVQLAYYCMDNSAHQMFKGNVDGPRCPQCKGMVNIKPVSTERYNELPTYESLRKSTIKRPKGIEVNILFDDNQILKLRAIAKHAAALADELEDISSAKCPDCGGLMDVTNLIADGGVVESFSECSRCNPHE